MHSAGVRWSSDTIHLSSSPRKHSISDNGRSREPLYGGSDEGDYPPAWQAWRPDPCLPMVREAVQGHEVELRRNPPSSMTELRATINSLAERMSLAEIRKAVNNVSKRAKACIPVSGDNFEHLLKKARRDVEE